MIKKLILLMMCIIILYACGRKNEPTYKTYKHNIIHIV